MAVVTGASRGIGRATAEAIAKSGAHVVMAARDREALEAVAGGIREAGGAATPVLADVSRAEDVDRLFTVAGRIGRPAALVCAAGMGRDPGDQPHRCVSMLPRGLRCHAPRR